MKKVLSLIAFFSLIAAGVHAQGISGGLKLGLNLANQTISGEGITISPSFRPALHAGGFLTIMLTENFGVQPEVLYSGQGYKQNGSVFKANYVTVPVLLRYNFTELFSIHAGPQIGILASAKVDDEDVKDQIKGTDIGIAAGLGIDLPIGLNFGFRFIKGMTNLIEDADSNDLKYKNYNIQFSVGYKLFGK